jgi:hypothetical protein
MPTSEPLLLFLGEGFWYRKLWKEEVAAPASIAYRIAYANYSNTFPSTVLIVH